MVTDRVRKFAPLTAMLANEDGPPKGITATECEGIGADLVLALSAMATEEAAAVLRAVCAALGRVAEAEDGA